VNSSINISFHLRSTPRIWSWVYSKSYSNIYSSNYDNNNNRENCYGNNGENSYSNNYVWSYTSSSYRRRPTHTDRRAYKGYGLGDTN